MPEKVVVFAPHPDDELIGCGGSLLKRIAAGHSVTVVYMTSGEGAAPAAQREKEAAQSCHFLGIEIYHFLREPDGFLTRTPQVTEAVRAILTEEQPHTVYVPHQHEKNSDHAATHSIVHSCLLQINATVLAYEVWTPLQNYGLIEDITDVIEKKVEALLFHHSQISQFPYDELAKTLARYRGIVTSGGDYCEVFCVERMIR
jgi:LmbE family N-acetylglucosaminyl deacetylase